MRGEKKKQWSENRGSKIRNKPGEVETEGGRQGRQQT